MKIMYFARLILQEFFSAVYLILLLPLCEFKGVLSVSDERFHNLNVVENFLFELRNAVTYDRLTDLQSTFDPDNSDFDKKKLFLEQYACEITKDLSSNKLSKYLQVCCIKCRLKS